MTEDRIAHKIRHLLAKADSTDHEAERMSLIAKADELMLKHAIDRATAEASADQTMGLQDSIEKVKWSMEYSEYYMEIHSMMGPVLDLARCRATNSLFDVYVVGHKSDILYAELLWNTIFREFVRSINPSWDIQRTFDANCKALRDAGYKWDKVREIANHNGYSVKNQACLDAYRRECDRLGVARVARMNSHKVYRDAFATSFASTTRQRINVLKRKREEAMSARDKELNLPLLANDAYDVDEAFYQYFPQFRPMTEEQKQEFYRKIREEKDSMSQADIDRQKKRDDAAFKRYQASQDRLRNSQGFIGGYNAANRVDLSMGNSGIQTERQEIE